MIGDWYADCCLCEHAHPAARIAYVDADTGLTVCIACDDHGREATPAELAEMVREHPRLVTPRTPAWLN